jgi:hypothetical protein
MLSSKIQTTGAEATLDTLLKHIRVVRNEENCPIQREYSLKALRENAHVEIVSEFLATVETREKLAALKKKPIK